MTNVIACIDGTAVTPAVCDYAAWASLRLGAPLILLHVLDKSEYPIESNLTGNIGLGSREALLEELAALDQKRGRLALEQGRLLLEEAQHRVINDGVSEPVTRQRHGSLIETLVDMEPDTRLLVLGKHDENLNEHIGSRLENVVRIMHRPILVTTDTYRPPRRFMVAFDGSETTRKGVEMIASSPLFRGLPCHLLLSGADNKVNQGQLAWGRDNLEAAGFEVHTALRSGDVERTLCDYRAEHDIDLLVMGAYGHSVIRRFLVGSTTTSVMRNASVPVLLLR